MDFKFFREHFKAACGALVVPGAVVWNHCSEIHFTEDMILTPFGTRKCFQVPGWNPEYFPSSWLESGKFSGFRVGTRKFFRVPGWNPEPGIPVETLELMRILLQVPELKSEGRKTLSVPTTFRKR